MRRWAGGIAGGLMTGALLAGCTTSSAETPEFTASESTSTPASQGPIESYESPREACDPSIGGIVGEDSPQFAAAAKECLDAYGAAEIVLVNYDLAADDAQSMASQLDRRI
ncbi:MAG: hypothetical protein JWR85_3952, partial [Marmoricola sp.]|nr:hypothetical protein [Marmoricola sp.]